jgi:3-phenylpropionate/cinnamic acid dioxygenase small subunit
VPSPPLEDVFAIHQLLARFGHVMDTRDWPALAEVFTDDAVYDVSSVGLDPIEGLATMRAFFEEAQHPLAHHVTNVCVTRTADGETHAASKILGVLRAGHVSTGTYQDTLVRTSEGWRIRSRIASRRRDEDLPVPPRMPPGHP